MKNLGIRFIVCNQFFFFATFIDLPHGGGQFFPIGQLIRACA